MQIDPDFSDGLKPTRSLGAFEAGLFGAPLRSQDTEMSEVTAFFLFSPRNSPTSGTVRTNPPRTKKPGVIYIYRLEEENLVRKGGVRLGFGAIHFLDGFFYKRDAFVWGGRLED